MATDPARVVRAINRAKRRHEVRKDISPLVAQYQETIYGHSTGQALPRDPMEFLAGTFTPLSPIQTTAVNVPDGDLERPGPRQREMPVGWNMPIGVPGSEGFKLASFGTLRMYADLYSVARAALQVRKSEIRGLEWDIMPTAEAERAMRGDKKAHKEFAERKAIAVKFFRKPDPDYIKFGSYIDAVIEEMLSVDALSLYLHPTKLAGKGPFGSSVAALELISGNTIRPLVNVRGGRVSPPSPGYQQYLYGVPRSDLMEILRGDDVKEMDGENPVKQYRGDQLMYLPYTARAWTPYGFPPIERSIIPVITGLRKQQFQMDFFDEGTIPGNYISPGEQLGWTPNQLEIWQNQQNALAGDPAWKHKSIALPPGSKVFPMRPVALADQFDEIVMTQVCMAFDVMPMELGVSPKVSTTQSPGAANQMAKASQSTNQRKSLKPTLAFLTDVFNVIIQEVWHQEDMRFVFEGLEEDEDENALVERLVQMVSFGFSSIDECRIALDKAPWGLPITSDPVFVSATAGMVPLGSIDPTSGRPMGTPPPQPIGAPPPPGGAPPAPGGPGSPPALPPGQKPPAGSPSPPGAAPKPPGAPPGQTPPPGGPPGAPPPHVGPAPGDKVGQSRQDAAEAHAGVQQQMHEDFAAGKPLEPPVRPPLTAGADEEHASSSSKAMLSELDALRRHLNKGRQLRTWETRYLPGLVMDHVGSLLKHLDPDDAAAVTREFVISAFGPPTITGQVEQVRKSGWEGELRDARGRWSKDPGAGTSDLGTGAAKPPTHMRTVATANNQARVYTDAQVQDLQKQINALRAELHAEKHKEAKAAAAIRLVSVAASIAMAFFTGGLSLVALGPLLLDKMPEVGRELAEYYQVRRQHTELPITPLKPGEKADDAAAAAVTGHLIRELMAAGVDPGLARHIATHVVQAAIAAMASGRQPWEPEFLPDDAVTGILHGQVAKVMSTSAPLNEQGGQQGLAPYDLEASGRPHRFAGGGYGACTFCDQPEGAQIHQVTKAGDAGPKARGTTTMVSKVGPKGYSHGWVHAGDPASRQIDYSGPVKQIAQKYRVPGQYTDASRRYAGLRERVSTDRAVTLWSSSYGDMLAVRHVMRNLRNGQHPYTDRPEGRIDRARFPDITNAKGDKVLFDQSDWDRELVGAASAMNELIDYDSTPQDHLYRGMSVDDTSIFKPGATFEHDALSWSGDPASAGRYARGEGVEGWQPRAHQVVMHGSGVPAVSLARYNHGPNSDDDEYVSRGKYKIASVRVEPDGTTHVEVVPA